MTTDIKFPLNEICLLPCPLVGALPSDIRHMDIQHCSMKSIIVLNVSYIFVFMILYAINWLCHCIVEGSSRYRHLLCNTEKKIHVLFVYEKIAVVTCAKILAWIRIIFEIRMQQCRLATVSKQCTYVHVPREKLWKKTWLCFFFGVSTKELVTQILASNLNSEWTFWWPSGKLNFISFIFELKNSIISFFSKILDRRFKCHQ